MISLILSIITALVAFGLVIYAAYQEDRYEKLDKAYNDLEARYFELLDDHGSLVAEMYNLESGEEGMHWSHPNYDENLYKVGGND